jgi:hypothetical protein
MGESLIIRRGGNGGGTVLNFNVISGTEQPTNPQENTVWVQTELEISSWTYDSIEPLDPSEGMVWLQAAENCDHPINALKKNAITLNIIGAHQYISKAWVSMESAVFKDGQWQSLKYWLIKDGRPVASTVGEFVMIPGSETANLKYNSDHINIYVGSTYNCRYTSTKKVACSRYRTICLDMSGSANDKTYGITSLGGVRFYIGNGTTSRRVLTADITSLNTDYEFQLSVDDAGVLSSCYVNVNYYNCWLE